MTRVGWTVTYRVKKLRARLFFAVMKFKFVNEPEADVNYNVDQHCIWQSVWLVSAAATCYNVFHPGLLMLASVAYVSLQIIQGNVAQTCHTVCNTSKNWSMKLSSGHGTHRTQPSNDPQSDREFLWQQIKGIKETGPDEWYAEIPLTSEIVLAKLQLYIALAKHAVHLLMLITMRDWFNNST